MTNRVVAIPRSLKRTVRGVGLFGWNVVIDPRLEHLNVLSALMGPGLDVAARVYGTATHRNFYQTLARGNHQSACPDRW